MDGRSIRCPVHGGPAYPRAARRAAHLHHFPSCRLYLYRKPMFRSAHLEMGDPGLLTGAVRAYYEALHHAPYCDPEAVHRTFAPDCRMGGYEPWGAPLKTDEQRREQVASFAQGLSAYIPACVGMRYETLIDDGRTCVIEWVHIVSKQGQRERNRVCLSGVSAYERKTRLSVLGRISDYAGERQIDWSAISPAGSPANNLVEVFLPNVAASPSKSPKTRTQKSCSRRRGGVVWGLSL
ncbi:MAG: nuclear transport factor 2 family protein [Eggerthellaceae bacterium]